MKTMGNVKTEKSSRPILFSSPMVRALLEGRKTQTRRIVKPQPEHVWGYGKDGLAHVRFPGGIQPDPWIKCPYGQVGDLLWVRESIRAESLGQGRWSVSYAADGMGVDLRREDRAAGDKPLDFGLSRRSIPSIHMPRWASRITLEITDIRVQRLQEISEEDIEDEGIKTYAEGLGNIQECPETLAAWAISQGLGMSGKRALFWVLWNSTCAKSYDWATNPWVWALTFRVVTPEMERSPLAVSSAPTLAENEIPGSKETGKGGARG